jgi:hypothetical protein
MKKQTEKALKMAYKAEETGNLQDLVDAVNALMEILEQPAQPLSDDVIYELFEKTYTEINSKLKFARAIEQAHGIGVKHD